MSDSPNLLRITAEPIAPSMVSSISSLLVLHSWTISWECPPRSCFGTAFGMNQSSGSR